MNTLVLGRQDRPVQRVWQTLVDGDRALAWFGLLLFALMVPAAIALGLDARELRGVPVWAKPLKFMASIGLFAWTTAWFASGLEAAQRRNRIWRGSVAVLVVAGAAELAYITTMAALGQGSHFNFSEPWRVVAYQLMGAGAMAMTATQVVLAVLLWQRRASVPEAWRTMHRAIVTGLAMTFVLGGGAGALLSAAQPPAGVALPLFGWHAAGDLRPAHFLGLHAQQLVPLAVWLWPWRGGLPVIAGYVLLWSLSMAMGLNGAAFTPPPGV
jgi:hypothetical protein